MATAQRYDPHAEMVRVASEFRHVREEHRGTRPEGSTRRHLAARLEELEERFERLLTTWEQDEERRAAWRDHLQTGAPPPPWTPVAPVVFRGVRAGGSRVEIRRRADHEYDLLVDGVRAERLLDVRGVEATAPGSPVVIGGVECREVFDARGEALDALRSFVEAPEGPPPWQYAWELLEDGLIDVEFALTPRGRRALAVRGS